MEADHAWLLNEAAYSLHALGRLIEALEPMRAGLESAVRLEDWKNAAVCAGNLSELELNLGQLTGEKSGAVHDAEQAVAFADRSGDAAQAMVNRTTLADALHQAGRRTDALARFREAETMQAEWQPGYPLLYSLGGFRYCDLLLADAERAAWQVVNRAGSAGGGAAGMGARGADSALADACRDVQQRAAAALDIVLGGSRNLLDIALNHLTLGRAGLYRALLEPGRVGRGANPAAAQNRATNGGSHPAALPVVPGHFDLAPPRSEIEQAVDGLRRAGQQQYIPLGLLSRAWLRCLSADSDGAHADLDLAWEIAERGPMPLFLADVRLHRARLFHAVEPYPWTSWRDDLAEARRLIEKHGYGRRLEELADAEEAAKNWRNH